jgi:DNA-binding NtrC family response regulator
MGKRVLAIDDDIAIGVTIQHVLGRAGHCVCVLSLAADALALVERERFDLVICDLVMPDIDGISAIKRLKAGHPDIPVIAMSGGARLGTLDTLALAREAGADELLRKPFDAASLRDIVNQALLRAG